MSSNFIQILMKENKKLFSYTDLQTFRNENPKGKQILHRKKLRNSILKIGIEIEIDMIFLCELEIQPCAN